METSHWRCDERAAEVAGANAPAEEEEELGDGHEEEYEEEYEEDGSDGRAHTPLCSKLRDAVDHAGLNDFMRVILEPLEEVFHGRGEITISSFTNRRIDIGIPKGRTVTMKLTQGEDRSLAVERLASELMVHVTRLHIDTNLEAVSSALHDLIDQLAPVRHRSRHRSRSRSRHSRRRPAAAVTTCCTPQACAAATRMANGGTRRTGRKSRRKSRKLPAFVL